MSTYTRSAISKSINDAADLVIEELNGGERDADLVSAVVNAALTMLDDPDASFRQIVEENYDIEESELRSWWGGWS
ncbi:hypothetical protein DR950_36010 [Kitasatospora xanthocidica]|uniref:Uncharacterized protein n=1 Tax=Kitasatospora xanthocidica TaxID=83382 RepID=A0A373A453_9ACTN|nr:hypothetical protein [Kitasatospora xanthocidica]RGD62442.1 hypothetical protein DR950_36010 [Kitasatospora xanthocidica]